ncbi:MORC family CW-type zinc finger protein 3-like isoform X1 [Biomphalaria glabrata]|uniref:MORC family CW-type zinc finger protein 3-like isoform X1 n=3 Tax=Biomphalaria glabrata TaxID=6526 RepID=A0A9U8EM71_BIOGL|nr:MORC family CW-type zinc finger protein 3-like isoform X1 [Biomphalaria glabrata]
MASSHNSEGILFSKISRKFLHSNSTSHVWAFGAFAELIDNAYDPDAQASQIHIDRRVIDEKTCLQFLDDGAGMNKEKLLEMLSFGYCEKDEFNDTDNHRPVGLYGNGFKSGSMRLGKDAIVFTRRRDTACIGLLSQTYLDDIKSDSVIVPILEYSASKDSLRRSRDVSENNVDAILRYSPFKSENELQEELNSLKEFTTGTKIIIYNLKKLQDGREELDFDSDRSDILCPVSYLRDTSDADSRPVQYIPNYKKSLREYCSILYLCPKMKIKIQNEWVKSRYISKTLHNTERQLYRPNWLEENRKSVMIILGQSCEIDSKENYGFLLYHKNRLIKPYLKIGCQKQANEKGVGIIGVAELDFLIPTHNKQDFVRDEHYNTVLNTLSSRLNTYLSDQNDVADVPLPDWTWAQCETCLKWRRLPKDIDPASLPKLWYCHMNQDVYYNRCFTEQEPEEETPRKSKRKKGSSQCGERENGTSSKKLFSSQPETFQENTEITVGGRNTRSKGKIAMPLEPPQPNHDDDDDAGDDVANGQESSSTVKIPNRKVAKRKLKISAPKSITKMSNIQKELSSSKGSSTNLCSSSNGKSPKRKIISADKNSEQPQSSKNIVVNGDDLQATGIIKKFTQRNIKSLQKSRNIETQSLNASQTVNTRSYVAKPCTNDTGFSETDSNTLDDSQGMTQNTGDDTGTETQEPEEHDVVVVDDDDDFDFNSLPLKCRPIIKSEPVTSEETSPKQPAETEEMERVAGSFEDSREEKSEDLTEVSRDSSHGEIKLTPFHYKVYRLLKYLAPSTEFGDTSEVEDIVNKLLENFENSENMN